MNVYFNGTVNLATVTTSDGLFYIAGGNQLQARRESDAGLPGSNGPLHAMSGRGCKGYRLESRRETANAICTSI